MTTLAEKIKIHQPFIKSAVLDAYVIVNSEGSIEKFNQLFSNMLGMKPRQLKNIKELSALIEINVEAEGADKESFKTLMASNQATVLPDTIIKTIAHDDIKSREIFANVGVSPIWDEDQYLGCMVMIRDITAEKNLVGKFEKKLDESKKDPLTGLFNRKYYEKFLQSTIIDASINREKNVSLIMSDIDHFKNINDTHGHPAGDYIIAEVSKVIQGILRKTDVLARYGGEEFVVVLDDTSLQGAGIVAEKVRQAVEGYHFQFDGKHIPVTISLGVAEYMNALESMENLVKRADESLYSSKENGRNQISISTGDGKILNHVYKYSA